MNYGILAILLILIVTVLALVIVAWFLMRSSSKTQATSDVKTQPVVQRFISSDLKKRAFVIRLNEGGYKVVFQRYSNEVTNLRGDVLGWQALPEKPVTDSLTSAVEIAQKWAHAED
jgi:ABC-type dipeptide/oligopeptide/nickel transport system permease component